MLDRRWKIIVFCVSGFVVAPALLRDCVENPSPNRSVFSARNRPAYNTLPLPPRAEDIVGTYTPDGETVAYIKAVQAVIGSSSPTNAQIKINKFGFEMRDIPFLENAKGGGRFRSLLSLTRDNTWNTYKEGNRWRIYFSSEHYEPIRADILENVPPYRIQLVVGNDSINKPLTFFKSQ